MAAGAVDGRIADRQAECEGERRDNSPQGEGNVVKWWDRFWGAVWIIGSLAVAYLTARWFATNAAPADLGGLRYGLIAFSGLFGLLVGALLLSIASIGIMSGVEALLARAGYPLERPKPTSSGLRIAQRSREGDEGPQDEPPDAAPTPAETAATPTFASSGHD